MIIPELQVVAEVFAERIVNTALEGVVLVGVVWLLLRFLGRQNSGTRFAIWLLALLALVALPFLSGSQIAGVDSLPHGLRRHHSLTPTVPRETNFKRHVEEHGLNIAAVLPRDLDIRPALAGRQVRGIHVSHVPANGQPLPE